MFFSFIIPNSPFCARQISFFILHTSKKFSYPQVVKSYPQFIHISNIKNTALLSRFCHFSTVFTSLNNKPFFCRFEPPTAFLKKTQWGTRILNPFSSLFIAERSQVYEQESLKIKQNTYFTDDRLFGPP